MDGLSHLTKIADGRNQSREEKPAVSSEPKAKVSAYIHWAKPKNRPNGQILISGGGVTRK